MRCAACGYGDELHEFGTRRCPPETADKNGRRGRFRVPDPPDTRTWQQRIKDASAARAQAIEDARRPYVPEVVPPPQVPARAPQGPGEFAGYGGRQAVGLGKAAAAAGWRVAAFYARSHDGEEMCAVKLAKDDLRAVATWTRKAGNIGKASGWGADIAYGWRLGTMPARINHTDLEKIING